MRSGEGQGFRPVPLVGFGETLQNTKVGQAFDTSNYEINEHFLHENNRGILLAEPSGLTSSESDSVHASHHVQAPSKSTGLCGTFGSRTRADDGDDSALLAVYHYDMGRRRMYQHCLPILVSLCKRMSATCCSQSVFFWMKTQQNKYAANSILRQLSMKWSKDDVQR